MSENLISRRAKKHANTIYEWFARQPLGPCSTEKTRIDLSSGDPTSYSFEFNSIKTDAISTKLLDARSWFHDDLETDQALQKIADLHSGPVHTFKKEDVFITQGGEFALTYGMRLMCKPGDNCILPSPGYWHLDLTGPCYDVETRTYGFKGDWEIDFEGLEKQIDAKTRFILVVSPGNPNCIFYDEETLSKFNKLAQKYSLILFADEIYFNCYFDSSQKHLSVNQLKPHVPILTMAGMAKMSAVPGYGLEWLTLKDTDNKVPQLRQALEGLILTFGTNSAFLINNLCDMMDEQGKKIRARMEHVKNNFNIVREHLEGCPGLHLLPTNASMFASIRIEPGHFSKELSIDQSFCSLLHLEEAVKLGRGLFNGEI